MKRFTTFASLILAVMIAQPVSAQFPADEIPRDLTSMEAFRYTGGYDGVYGPYKGIMTSMVGRPDITLYCVDYFHSISWNSGGAEGVAVNVWGLDGTPGSHTTTRLGVAGASEAHALFRYSQAAFLASLFMPGNPGGNWSGIHAAIWEIMSPGYEGGAAADEWLALVDDTFVGGYTFDTSGWAVLTDKEVAAAGPNGNVGVQEYLVRTTVTPEPETYVLMASGLLLMGFFGRRRRLREMQET